MVDVIDSIADSISIDADKGGKAVGIQVAQYFWVYSKWSSMSRMGVHLCVETTTAADAPDANSRKPH